MKTNTHVTTKSTLQKRSGVAALISTFVATAATLQFCSSAAAASLIVNGDFETGDFSNWTVSNLVVGPFGYSSVDIMINDPSDLALVGQYTTRFNAGDSSPTVTLSQSFATTVGMTYELKFDLATYNLQPYQHTLVNISNSDLSQQSASSPDSFATFDYLFTATSTSSTLSFTDDPNNITQSSDTFLDNVSVTAVPEPGTALFGIAFVGVAALRRRRQA